MSGFQSKKKNISLFKPKNDASTKPVFDKEV